MLSSVSSVLWFPCWMSWMGRGHVTGVHHTMNVSGGLEIGRIFEGHNRSHWLAPAQFGIKTIRR